MSVPYLDMLFEWASQDGAKTVVELGVGEGHSTIALLKGVAKSGSHLYSVDKNLEVLPKVYKRIREAGLGNQINVYALHMPNWTLILEDDLELAERWNLPIDLLFVDTSHMYQHTLDELEAYAPFMAENGAILIHDTLFTLEDRHHNPEGYDVTGAIEAFLAKHSEWEFTELLPDDPAGCGLGLLKRREVKR